MMRDLPNFKFSQANITPIAKYVLINRDILPKLLLKLNGQEFVFVNQAMNWVDEIPFVAENPDRYLAQFSEILPIPNDLIQGVQSVSPEPLASKSFFDLEISPMSPSHEASTPNIPEIKPEIYSPKPIELGDNTSIYQKKIDTISEVIAERNQTKEQDSVRLNEKLGSEHKSLNDQMHNQSLVDYHQQNRIEGIAGAISLNQRYLFTNHLFGGNIQAFSHALEELELCKDFGEAKELILKKYVPRYMWAITSAEAEEFFEIVKRRFS